MLQSVMPSDFKGRSIVMIVIGSSDKIKSLT